MEPYETKKTEEEIRKFWEKEKIYKFDSKKKGKVYSIDTPPPTVSGNMHMGHAFSYSQQDFIARFRRMSGNNLFYPFGTDDNGLPTERLVEKLKNVKSKEMSRSDFIKLCLTTLKQITPEFVEDWKRIGVSADFNLSYSTIDENSRRLSQNSFLDLYKKGQAYKKEFPSIWCPECQTSIAQAELEDKEIPSLFVTVKFSVSGKDLLIATTRPELLGACVAVFVHPDDKRYKALVGKKAKVPIFGFEVPIIADKSANSEKGTGALMVCSYGDKYDVDAVNRHKLKPRVILDKRGIITTGPYSGLRTKQARRKVIEDLEQKNLITNKKEITHVVNVHDKCGTEIEFIPTEQWFVKILDKKKELLKQGSAIKWHPDHMNKRYSNWINGLDWDWNISRDRHFGVPIPVWECKECGEVILPTEKELPIDPLQTKKKCPKCKKEAKGEEKVFDTWATSSLSPQITSNLVNNKIKIPYSLRPQSHDIIRTWAFYTIVKSYLHEKEIPWNDIMVSGFVTLKGEKMSKSKGNVVEPKTILEQYGADALRFWAAGSKLGEDLDYQEQDLVAGKRFINKLINSSKFVFMNMKDYKPKKPKKLEKIDELFLKKLDYLINSVNYRFETYDYSKAKFNAEDFFWKLFCDSYLEIVKWRIYNGKKQEKESAFYTLYTSLLAILKMMAPITPFITEYIYQTHFRKNEKEKSIHISEWPKYQSLEKGMPDQIFDKFIAILRRVRQEKTIAKKSMNSEIVLTITKADTLKVKELLEDLKHVTNAKEIKEGEFKVEFI